MQPTKVIKRTGEIVEFDEERIRNAILKAVMATGKKLSAATVDAIGSGPSPSRASRTSRTW